MTSLRETPWLTDVMKQAKRLSKQESSLNQENSKPKPTYIKLSDHFKMQKLHQSEDIKQPKQAIRVNKKRKTLVDFFERGNKMDKRLKLTK